MEKAKGLEKPRYVKFMTKLHVVSLDDMMEDITGDKEFEYLLRYLESYLQLLYSTHVF